MKLILMLFAFAVAGSCAKKSKDDDGAAPVTIPSQGSQENQTPASEKKEKPIPELDLTKMHVRNVDELALWFRTVFNTSGLDAAVDQNGNKTTVQDLYRNRFPVTPGDPNAPTPSSPTATYVFAASSVAYKVAQNYTVMFHAKSHPDLLRCDNAEHVHEIVKRMLPALSDNQRQPFEKDLSVACSESVTDAIRAIGISLVAIVKN